MKEGKGMINMCAYRTCPHHAEPCEFSDEYLNRHLGSTTICPIGEEECLIEYDPANTFFCLVVGTKTFMDYNLFSAKLNKLLSTKHEKTIIIVSGDADGADKLAEKYASEHGYHIIVFQAHWEEYGKKAGPLRNEQMHKFISSKEDRGVVAFWDGKSKGTAQSFTLAQKYGNQLRIIQYGS